MPASVRYQHLFKPGNIGSITVKNRIVKMGANPGFWPYEDGDVQQGVKDYYEAIAKGGVGLLVAGAGEPDWPIGTVPGLGYRLDQDRYIPSLAGLAEVIKPTTAPRSSRCSTWDPCTPRSCRVTSPSPRRPSRKGSRPCRTSAVARELATDEVGGLLEKLVGVAERACRAGFDGIELNAGCNHLLNSFLSRAWNKRHDDYGCDSLENRARMVVELIQGVKQTCGAGFGLIALLNGAEPGLTDGLTLAESIQFAKRFEAAGADAIHVRAEFYRPRLAVESTHFPDMALYPEAPFPVGDEIDARHHGAGAWVPMAAAVKKAVSVPVIAVGRLDPDRGEDLLRRGVIDFVNMNRRLMADHDLPNKLAAGRPEDVAPCTACMTCFDATEQGQFPRCRINASLAREREYEIVPAATKKRVVVIGGGPAGMETARVAALRGHRVSLYDKGSRLGGSMPVANVVKGFDREDLGTITRYFDVHLRTLGVEVHLRTDVDRALVAGLRPEVVVIAAGGVQDVPELPGIDGGNVLSGAALRRDGQTLPAHRRAAPTRELTRVWMPLGAKVVIIGGGIHGCQTAEFLVKRGRTVTLVEAGEEFGAGLPESLVKPYLLQWLTDHGVRMLAGATCEEITERGLVVTTKEGERITLDADTVVTALPLRPNTVGDDAGGVGPRGLCHRRRRGTQLDR